MSAHTPGPWRPFLHLGGVWGVTSAPLSEPRGGEITEIVFGPRGGSAEANARLIAASPTMAEYIERRANAGDEEARAICAAIAKATGAA